MKKIILTAAAIAALTTSSAYAVEDMFYVKANVGWSKLDKTKGMKSNNDAFLGLGVGYGVMDNLRAELTFDYFTNPNYKGKVRIRQNGVTADLTNGKIKTQASTLMLNGFVDLFDVSIANIFVGAGVGMSIVSGKLTASNTAAVAGLPANVYEKYRQKNNFAYALHLGGSAEVSPGVHAELAYSYRDMGKAKKAKDSYTFSSPHLKGHHIAAGIRFAI